MGNKIEIDRQDTNPRTPKKSNLSHNLSYSSNKSRSAQKDGLYADERFFENYDSKNF